MDKSIEKGKIRNRYTKLQPLVNRINEFQCPHPAPSYHCAKSYDKCGINSHAYQLKNDYGNLVLGKSMESNVIKKPIDTELRTSEMPMVLFDQSVLIPATSAETARRQKKHKHGNKAKPHHTSLLDLKVELLDILNCILYLIWSPIVFFVRFTVTLVSSSASVLYNIAHLSTSVCTDASKGEKELNSDEIRPIISNICPAKSRRKRHPSADLNKFPMKQNSNFNSTGYSLSHGVKNSVLTAQSRVAVEKSHKELQSMRKEFNSSRQMVGEKCGNLGVEIGNYLQYSACHQDISSVEMSSDCFSDKYSSRFLDCKDCRKRAPSQYRNSDSVTGKETSVFTLRNFSLKSSRTAVSYKRSHIHTKKSSHRNEPKGVIKNVDPSDTSEFSERETERIDPKNRSNIYDGYMNSKLELISCNSSRPEIDGKFKRQKKSSATLLSNLRKKRYETPRLRASFPSSPLGLTSEEKSFSKDEQPCGKMAKKYNYTSFVDPKSNLVPPQLNNSHLQLVVDPHQLITETAKGLSQKVELTDTAVDAIGFSQYKAEKEVCEQDAKFSSLQCKSHLSTIIAENLENFSHSNKAAQSDEHKELTETSHPLSLGRADKDLLQPEKLCQGLEGDKKTNGSGDYPKARKNDKLETTELTKPIDAKSKWIEMKKKFYGKDYETIKQQPEKMKVENLSRITSISKLPAQKIFQYNMQVGRARQTGEEPPSAEEIFLERKSTSPCLKNFDNSLPGSNPNRNEYLKSLSLTSRGLSQTQSLFQWPIGQGNFPTAKKNCVLEHELKPKARTQGRSNLDKILDDVKDPNSFDDYANKINALISFCSSPPLSVPEESDNRDSKEANEADCKFAKEAAAGDSS